MGWEMQMQMQKAVLISDKAETLIQCQRCCPLECLENSPLCISDARAFGGGKDLGGACWKGSMQDFQEPRSPECLGQIVPSHAPMP